jgi:hypothetical protein
MIMEVDIKRVEIPNDDGSYTVKVTPAPWSGITNTFEMRMSRDQFRRYLVWKSNNTQLIQNVFPELPADQREGLLSGIGPEDWKDMMSEPEEDDDKPVD